MLCYRLQCLLFLYLTHDITQNQCSKPCAKKSKLHETLKKFKISKHEISMAVICLFYLLSTTSFKTMKLVMKRLTVILFSHGVYISKW